MWYFYLNAFLFSQVWNCHPIVRRIAGNTCYNACAFLHADGHHWQCVYFLINCQGGFQWESHQFLSCKFVNDLYNFLFLSQSLVSHISSRSLWTNENFIVLHFNSNVLPSWQKIATSLPIHRFRSQSGSNQIDISAFQWFFKLLVELKNLYFN